MEEASSCASVLLTARMMQTEVSVTTDTVSSLWLVTVYNPVWQLMSHSSETELH